MYNFDIKLYFVVVRYNGLTHNYSFRASLKSVKCQQISTSGELRQSRRFTSYSDRWLFLLLLIDPLLYRVDIKFALPAYCCTQVILFTKTHIIIINKTRLLPLYLYIKTNCVFIYLFCGDIGFPLFSFTPHWRKH